MWRIGDWLETPGGIGPIQGWGVTVVPGGSTPGRVAARGWRFATRHAALTHKTGVVLVWLGEEAGFLAFPIAECHQVPTPRF